VARILHPQAPPDGSLQLVGPRRPGHMAWHRARMIQNACAHGGMRLVARLRLVRSAAVLGNVHAGRLHLGRDAQHAGHLEEVEHDQRDRAGPAEDDGHLGESRPHDVPVRGLAVGAVRDEEATLKAPLVLPRGALAIVEFGSGEEASREHAPGPASPVHRDGVDRVVDLAALENGLLRDEVEDAAHEADEESEAGSDGGAARGDRHEAGEEAVARGADRIRMVAKKLLEEDDDEAGNGGRDGGGHDGARGARRVARRGHAEGGARVEAVPAEPEHEGARHHQGRRVPGHRERLLLLVKAAHARAHDGRTKQGGNAARHVHDARAFIA